MSLTTAVRSTQGPMAVAIKTKASTKIVSPNGTRIVRRDPHHPEQSIMTTEPPVDAGDVAQTLVRRRQAGILQQLRAQNATAPVLQSAGSIMCSHFSSSCR